MEKLPTNYDVPDGAIPYRLFIPGIARQLTMMPRRGISPKVAQQETKKLATLAADARSLASRIQKLPRAGDVSLLLDATGGFEFRDLAELLNRLGDAAKTISSIKAAPAGKSRRPSASIADNIALYLCQEYERVTGERPTLTVRNNKAAGAILDLVSEVFEALAIEASPEATVRKVRSAGYSPGFPGTPDPPSLRRVMEKKKKRRP